MQNHDQAVLRQFDAQAAAYFTSPVHAAGADLDWLRDVWLPSLPAGGRALDAGCGAGHLGFTLAGHFAEVVAVDPSAGMLETVAGHAARQGLPVTTCRALADDLPFESASFDLVASRYSAHHWLHLERSLQELHRVLRPGGHLLLIDVLGDESVLVDTHLQAIELLRDPSHICDRSSSAWQRLLAAAEFEIVATQAWPLRLEFASWAARMRTPELQLQAIRALQTGAPQEVRSALQLEDDGSFSVRTGAFVAMRRG
jgi:ubiquinone/menaquinone biosynthesis C-methylase UbiE